ncbi:ABC transporter substrate-binding protein [Oceanobacillus piezotolerans]|uniref:ABC transporter substrate-binding protein n=1 Tax=Oceanobacillus piezotolerans TaxID=2448030 RepID=A0A498D4Y9_9BACI|nr:ABC transporter substrate-binding protein [Oceanobacillus piezotolerans]
MTLGLISLVFVVSACGFTATEDKEEIPTIKIGYLPITHAIPLYLQDEIVTQGEQDYKIELVKFPSWPDLMDALNTGRIDGASVLVAVAMKAKELGIDLKAVALGHRDGNVIIAGNDIHNVQDLKGKSFAIPHKLSTHNVLLYEMLTREGMQYDDVNVIEMTPAEMPAALAENRIAGYVVAEPFGAQSVVMDNGHVLYQSEELWQNSVDCAIVLRQEFMEENSDLAQAFMNSYVEAGNQAQQKDEHVYEVSSKFMKVDETVMDLSLKWIAYDNLRINEQDYSKLSDYLIEMGLSKKPPAYEDFVDNSLIDEAM